MPSTGGSRDLSKLIDLPFSRGAVEAGTTARTLLVVPPGDLELPQELADDMLAVQGFRPDFLALEQRGLSVIPDFSQIGDSGSFDLAVVCLSRHRRWNDILLAEAAKHCADGGTIVAAGSKNDGAGAIRKALARLTDDLQSLPKHHGLVMWFRIEEAVRQALTADLLAGNEASASGYVTAPGGFSAERIDAGSALLAEHLPTDLTGAMADFCAGWGYLSVIAAERCPDLHSMDLFEADWASLEAAKSNLANVSPETFFYWHDLVGEPVAHRFDTIVMNPPFHTGRAAEPALGLAIIERAAASLNAGGRLFMVANRQLPYEALLDRRFARVNLLAETPVYKVIEAARPVSRRQ